MLKHVCGFLVCCCALLTNYAHSADEVREIVVARGGDGFYPPFEMETDNGLTGFHIDFVKAVAQRLHVKVTFKTYPWKRAVNMLKDGHLDAITYMSKTKKREKLGYFLEGNVLSVLQDAFFILEKRAQDISYSGALKQLKPYMIGTLRGYSYGHQFDDATYLRKDDRAHTEEQLINKLLRERFDIALGGKSRIRYIAQKMGLAN